MTSTTPSGSGTRRARAGLRDERRTDPLRSRPAPQVLQRVVDLVEHEPDVGRPGFETRLAEVGGERGDQVGLPLGEHRAERLELLTPPLERTGAAGLERAAQARRRARRRRAPAWRGRGSWCREAGSSSRGAPLGARRVGPGWMSEEVAQVWCDRDVLTGGVDQWCRRSGLRPLAGGDAACGVDQ